MPGRSENSLLPVKALRYGEAAIDKQAVAADVARLIGSEKKHRSRDFFRSSNASGGSRIGEVVFLLLVTPEPVLERGVDQADALIAFSLGLQRRPFVKRWLDHSTLADFTLLILWHVSGAAECSERISIVPKPTCFEYSDVTNHQIVASNRVYPMVVSKIKAGRADETAGFGHR